MSKKWLSVIGLSTVGLIVSACGSSGSKTGEDVPAPKQRDPVELVFYYTSPADWNEDTFMGTFGNYIKEKLPHITPKFLQAGTGTNLPELVAAGQQIDVIFVSTGLTSRMTDVNLQYDVTPLLKQMKYNDSHLEPQALAAGREIAKGGLYGLPVYTVPATMYYNKDIFDKFGVAYPKDGQTWDDVYEIAKKINRSDGNSKYMALRTSFGHFLHLNSFSLDLVSPKTNRSDFSDEKWKRVFENIQRFYQFADTPATKADMNLNKQRDAFFKDQNVGMWLALTNLHVPPELNNQFNWDIASFPVFPGTKEGPQPYPTYFYVTSTSKHKEDAMEAIALLTSKEYQMEKSKSGQLLTILKDPDIRAAFGQQEGSIYKGKNVKALLPETYAKPSYYTPYASTVRSELEKVLMSVIVGEKDINTALREAQEISNQKIDAVEGK
jgi:multiple sugar transport system substrate-binding protein